MGYYYVVNKGAGELPLYIEDMEFPISKKLLLRLFDFLETLYLMGMARSAGCTSLKIHFLYAGELFQRARLADDVIRSKLTSKIATNPEEAYVSGSIDINNLTISISLHYPLEDGGYITVIPTFKSDLKNIDCDNGKAVAKALRLISLRINQTSQLPPNTSSLENSFEGKAIHSLIMVSLLLTQVRETFPDLLLGKKSILPPALEEMRTLKNTYKNITITSDGRILAKSGGLFKKEKAVDRDKAPSLYKLVEVIKEGIHDPRVPLPMLALSFGEGELVIEILDNPYKVVLSKKEQLKDVCVSALYRELYRAVLTYLLEPLHVHRDKFEGGNIVELVKHYVHRVAIYPLVISSLCLRVLRSLKT